MEYRKQDERVTIMGMAASQARFLSLTARKNNVEFEGQQINQQRTTLSNESSGYYSNLCNLAVPTPPSSEDYVKTTYSFTDGSETNTVNSLIAKQNGLYILNYTQTYETENVVSNGSVVTTKVAGEDGNEAFYVGSTPLRTIRTDATVDSDDIKNDPYLSELLKESPDLVEDILKMEVTYLGMLQEKYGANEWFVRYQKKSGEGNAYEPVFYNKQQVESADYSERTGTSLSGIKSYVYGQTIESREIKNATARADQDTSGRYTTIYIYDTDDEGNIKKDNQGNDIYVAYALQTITECDDNAYNDAMNQYNYNKARYDQEIQAINSKIHIVQAQDKDLELRLKQLDTEEKALDSELEAVKKVIQKNVDSSFKTFNA